MAKAIAEQTGTRGLALDSAERLVQARGFNGFSYADVATELGITKAALHYHYAGKAELGTALIVRYAARFTDSLAGIEANGRSAFEQLAAYTDLYLGVLTDERMCLCGMLAAEYNTLPEPMRHAVVEFFDSNHAWLTRLLNQGLADGSINFVGRAKDVAQLIVGTLEGAMLVARPYANTTRFKAVADQLLGDLNGRRAGTRPRQRQRRPPTPAK